MARRYQHAAAIADEFTPWLTSPEKRDLSEELRRSGLVPVTLWTNHHVLCEVLRWLDDDELLIRLHGYGDADPGGFTRRYRYSLNGVFQVDR